MNKKFEIYNHDSYKQCKKLYIDKKYDQSLNCFCNLEENLEQDPGYENLTILYNVIASSAAGAILINKIENTEKYYKKFWNYLDKYLDAYAKSLNNGDNWGSHFPLIERLDNCLQLLIKYDLEHLQAKAMQWGRRFLMPSTDFPAHEYIMPQILRHIYLARSDSRRDFEEGVKITKDLIMVYLELTSEFPDEIKDNYRKQRTDVMNVMSDLVYFEEESARKKKKSHLDALYWIKQALQESPDNKFAQIRKKQIEEREAVMEQIRRFTHDSSNLISGLITTIRTVIKGDDNFSSKTKTKLYTIENELYRLHGIKKFVRKEQCQKKEIEITNFIQRISRSQEGVDFVYSGFDNPIYFMVDEDYFELAFSNLIKNSVEAFARNEIEVNNRKIEISIEKKSTKDLEIKYLDNAGGVPEALQDKLFDKYVSSKGISRGTGLGLSQAKLALELTGGNITYPQDKQPSGGSFFKIQLHHESEE